MSMLIKEVLLFRVASVIFIVMVDREVLPLLFSVS